MISENDISKEIVLWLKKKRISNVKDKEDLILSKKLDSLNFVQLVLFCEKKFNIKFDKDNFLLKDFATLDKLKKIIFKKCTTTL